MRKPQIVRYQGGELEFWDQTLQSWKPMNRGQMIVAINQLSRLPAKDLEEISGWLQTIK